MSKTLRALEGTDYTAIVVQQGDTDYLVKVQRPLRSGEKAMFHKVLGHDPLPDVEEVGSRYLAARATEKDLNRAVEDIINADTPSIVGVYTGEKETE